MHDASVKVDKWGLWVEVEAIICKPILLLQRVLNKADLCIKYVMMIIL